MYECMRRGVVISHANANQPTGQIIFSSIVHGDSEIFEHALRFLINLGSIHKTLVEGTDEKLPFI